MKVERNTIIITSGQMFDTALTIDECKQAIKDNTGIKVYLIDHHRTGYRDVLYIPLFPTSDVGFMDRLQADLLEDGKEKAEKEARKWREEHPETEAETVEETTTDETVEEVKQETL